MTVRAITLGEVLYLAAIDEYGQVTALRRKIIQYRGASYWRAVKRTSAEWIDVRRAIKKELTS